MALQSLSQFSSSVKHAALRRGNGNSQDSSGLFRGPLVKPMQPDLLPCSGRQLIQGQGQRAPGDPAASTLVCEFDLARFCFSLNFVTKLTVAIPCRRLVELGAPG